MSDPRETQHLSRGRWVLYGFLAVAGFFLFTEHRAHVFCPGCSCWPAR